MFSRSNTASALTRAIKPLVATAGVKVKSDDRFRSATITGEIEQLMSARELLSKDARFALTTIHSHATELSDFYVTFA